MDGKHDVMVMFVSPDLYRLVSSREREETRGSMFCLMRNNHRNRKVVEFQVDLLWCSATWVITC